VAIRSCLLVAFLFAASDTARGQANALSFRPLRAEYTPALERIVFVSAAPHQLHIYDPVGRTDQVVPLALAPVSLSISPDGVRAAVGHLDSASYINLTTRTVERVYNYPLESGSSSNTSLEVSLGSEWLYVLSTTQGHPISIRLSTGAGQRSYPPDGTGRLHPSGRALYVADQELARYDVDTGPIAAVRPSRLVRGNAFCPGIWFSPAANRIYSACGGVALQSDELTNDMAYIGRLPGRPFRWITESASLSVIAVIPDRTSFGGVLNEGDLSDEHYVRLIQSVSHRDLGRIALPRWNTTQGSHRAHGRWAFFNGAGNTLFIVHQADSQSGISNDFAVEVHTLSNPPPCVARFDGSGVSVPGQGALRTVNILATTDCVYKATSATDWIEVVGGGSGTGDSSMTVHVRANPSASARSGTINLGSQTFTVTQQSASSVGTLQQLSYRVVDAEFNRILDRLVLVSAAPDELHLLDPLNRNDQFVKLTQPPLAVSVRPDGLYAAVGHMGAISYVNLQTLLVEKVLPIRAGATDLVLASNGYVYSFAPDQGYAVHIASGASTPIPGGSAANLHASGNYIYFTNPGGLENGTAKIDIRQNPPVGVLSSLPFLNCGNLWPSEDGTLFFTGCAQVYASSENTQVDGTLLGRLAGFSSSVAAAWIAASTSRQQIVALTGYESVGGSPYTELHLYTADGVLLGRLQLATHIDGPNSFGTRGKWSFWNRLATRIYVVSKVEGSGGPLSDSFVEVIAPESVAACTVGLASTSEGFPAEGGTRNISVTAAAGCAWRATVPSQFSNWMFVPTNADSGTGNGSFVLSVHPNTGFQGRTGTVQFGNQTLTITQAPLPAFAVAPLRILRLSPEGLQTVIARNQNPQVSFTAISNATWLTISFRYSNGEYFVDVRIAANTGPARTGTLTIGGQTVTVEQAGAPQAGAMKFVPLPPCRIVDTRGETGQTGAFGPPFMAAGSQRDFPLPQGACNIPVNATAYSLNVTVVPRGGLSYLTLFPTGQSRPLVSTLNSFEGRIKANAAIVPAGSGGGVSVFVTNETHVILDVNGYFVDGATANPGQTYSFFPVAPCRLVDTRNAVGPGGGPSVNGGQARTFTMASLNSACPFEPLAVRAYALNITAIPKSGSLSYLTAWQAGAHQPVVSTLNSFTGTVVANAAIVPAGVDGNISVFVTDAADVLIDMVGYFALPLTDIRPLSFYALSPCRVLDTREAPGPLGGPQMATGSSRSIPITASPCGVPVGAQGYALNATVVPPGPLSFLTLWPAGGTQPGVSTLNAFDGTVVANAAIVPAGSTGAVQAFVSNASHLILDVSGYFAP
jgi:hypothetical protein